VEVLPYATTPRLQSLLGDALFYDPAGRTPRKRLRRAVGACAGGSRWMDPRLNRSWSRMGVAA
jgi:hypothetical protein